VTSTDSTPGARSRLPQVRRRPRPAGAPSLRTPTRQGTDFVVDCAVYVDGRRQSPIPYDEALRAAVDRGGFVWLGLHEPTEAELEGVAAVYGLHPLAVEDAVEAHQRPKLDSYDDSLFMVC
jgi:magnesium transporter